MRIRNQSGLANWAKWLIGIVATVLVVGLGSCTIMGFLAYNYVKDAADPSKAKELASTMVTIKEPLPKRFEYKAGMNIFETVSFVTILDKTNEYSYSLVKMMTKEKEKVSAEDLVEELAARGVPSGGSSANTKIKVQEKGSMEVGGVEMPYVIGITENKQRTVPALMGVVIPNDKNVLMLIVFAPPKDKTIDVEQTKAFFSNISSFK